MPHLHRLAGVFIVVAVLVGLLAPGSEPARSENRTDRDASTVPAARRGPEKPGQATPATDGAKPAVTPPAPPKPPTAQQVAAARTAKANELGMIPVFMYHRILKDTELSLDRSLEQFRDELTRLAEEGYVPVTAAEYASGRIALPAGRHPVVLTFDDASPSQLVLDAAGAPRGDTAVGILYEVARKHPGFRPVATMYVNKDPFQMGPKAKDGLRWLLQRGFEIGNHTNSHGSLATMSKDDVRQEIGRNQKMIHDLAGVNAITFAYPFGAAPKKQSWATKGDAEGAKWDFSAVFLAGWMPAPSPYDEAFDAEEVPRIRSEGKIGEDDCKQFCSTAWLDRLKENPEDRYTSDGDPATIAFPQSEQDRLPKKLAGSALAY